MQYGNNGFVNALQCYVIRTLPFLFLLLLFLKKISSNRIRSSNQDTITLMFFVYYLKKDKGRWNVTGSVYRFLMQSFNVRSERVYSLSVTSVCIGFEFMKGL